MCRRQSIEIYGISREFYFELIFCGYSLHDFKVSVTKLGDRLNEAYFLNTYIQKVYLQVLGGSL